MYFCRLVRQGLSTRQELPLRALGGGATVVHINPVLFDVSNQEHFLQGSASVMMESLLQGRPSAIFLLVRRGRFIGHRVCA